LHNIVYAKYLLSELLFVVAEAGQPPNPLRPLGTPLIREKSCGEITWN